jgi:hypothetical protein
MTTDKDAENHVCRLQDQCLFRELIDAGARAWTEHGQRLRYGRFADRKLEKEAAQGQGQTEKEQRSNMTEEEQGDEGE